MGGLQFYERLARELPKYLRPSGKVWLEMGIISKKRWRRCFQIPVGIKKQERRTGQGMIGSFYLKWNEILSILLNVN